MIYDCYFYCFDKIDNDFEIKCQESNSSSNYSLDVPYFTEDGCDIAVNVEAYNETEARNKALTLFHQFLNFIDCKLNEVNKKKHYYAYVSFGGTNISINSATTPIADKYLNQIEYDHDDSTLMVHFMAKDEFDAMQKAKELFKKYYEDMVKQFE